MTPPTGEYVPPDSLEPRDYWRRLSVGRHVLFSINPDPSDAIFAGRKGWEYRTKPPAQDPPYLGIVYETAPTQAIVGLFYAVKYKTGPAKRIADWTVEDTPSTHADLVDYAGGPYMDVTAIDVTLPLRLDSPITRERIQVANGRDWSPPQNYHYLGLKTHPELVGIIGSRLVIGQVRDEAARQKAEDDHDRRR